MDKLIPVEFSNQRVLLTSQLAEQYETEPQVITNNFNRNKEHYQEGKHFYALEGEDFKQFKATTQIDFSPNINKLYLWTEKGALLHAKSLGTEKAWEVYEMLVDTYFKVQSFKPMTQVEMLAAQAQAMVQLERKANTALETASRAQNKVENALNVLAKPPEPDWQESTREKIIRMCAENGLSYLKVYDAMYRELERGTHSDLKACVRNKKRRMKSAGATEKEIRDITELFIVAHKPPLKMAFDGIVRRYAAKYQIVKEE